MNQILSAFVIINKCGTYVSNKILDFLENTTMYSVVHDTIDPFTKTYSTIFIPYMTFTLNHSTYSFEFNCSNDKKTETNFFEDCIVNDKTFKHCFSKKKTFKITSDYKRLPFISMSISNHIFHKLHTLYTDIELTANHICAIMYLDVGTKVMCTDDNLDEFTFKDIDVIKK